MSLTVYDHLMLHWALERPASCARHGWHTATTQVLHCDDMYACIYTALFFSRLLWPQGKLACSDHLTSVQSPI